jgi:hypothetical protein
MPEAPVDYGLWVSADDRLVLLRGAGADPVTVSRGGRALEAPVGKPVILLDQDQLAINGRRLRVHLHGPAIEAHPPERLSRSALARIARATVTTLALGAAFGVGSAAGEPAGLGPATAIEVRAQPPAPPPAPRVDCTITRMQQSKQGLVLVHARCPPPTPRGRVAVGARGQIVDPKSGVQLPDGEVVVKKVEGEQVICESKLKKPIKATLVRFWLSRY